MHNVLTHHQLEGSLRPLVLEHLCWRESQQRAHEAVQLLNVTEEDGALGGELAVVLELLADAARGKHITIQRQA